MNKPVAIGSDEAGFRLKGVLIEVLGEEGVEVADFGCHSEDPVDYPDVAFEVAQAVARGEHDRGILICGTGIGMSIAANKVPGVRAAQAHDAYSAERARKSNDAQILALGSATIDEEQHEYDAAVGPLLEAQRHAHRCGDGPRDRVVPQQSLARIQDG